MSIESHLKKHYSDEPKEEVLEIILDSLNVPEIKTKEKKILEEFKNAQLFSMNYCGVKSLDNLPDLPSLEAIDLNDNKIKGEELSKLSIYKNLIKLKLSNNLINSLEDLKSLTSLSNLELLDLTECPICKIKDYREQVFKILPNLKILDLMYKDGTIYESESEMEDFENGSEEDYEDEDFLDEEGESQFDEDEEEEMEEDEDEECDKSRKKQKTDE